jgi:cardiolipin synthase
VESRVGKFIKTLINAILIIFQLIVFIVVVSGISDFAYGIYWVIELIAILVVLDIVYHRDEASAKISWIILVLIIPIFGIALYLIWGKRRLSKKNKAVWDKAYEKTYLELEQDSLVYQSIENPRLKNEIDLNQRMGDLPVWKNTQTEYLKVGEEMHRVHLEMIRQAKCYVFLEYFIIAKGKMYEELMTALTERADAGVEVRIMVDEMGSFFLLPKDFYKRCAEHNIKAVPFNPLFGSLYRFISFRDHRKITIIDGNVAIVGGVNIGDEYINAIEVYGHWKDMAVRLEGDAVLSLLTIYVNMWNYLSKEKINIEDYKSDTKSLPCEDLVMPFSDGPTHDGNLAASMYMKVFANAKDYVYISTPYLILDTDMTNCILLAARSGVDVRIITPGIPDKKIVYATTRAFYGDLLAEGVRIFEYTPGFNHGKVLASDDEVCIIGSINMDYRSLAWNYECSTWISSEETVVEVRTDLLDVISVSREIFYEDWEKSSFLKKLFQAILRIGSPLM